MCQLPFPHRLTNGMHVSTIFLQMMILLVAVIGVTANRFEDIVVNRNDLNRCMDQSRNCRGIKCLLLALLVWWSFWAFVFVSAYGPATVIGYFGIIGIAMACQLFICAMRLRRIDFEKSGAIQLTHHRCKEDQTSELESKEN